MIEKELKSEKKIVPFFYIISAIARFSYGFGDIRETRKVEKQGGCVFMLLTVCPIHRNNHRK